MAVMLKNGVYLQATNLQACPGRVIGMSLCIMVL